jgi:hypothetical protein
MNSTSNFNSTKKSKYNLFIFIFIIVSFSIYQFYPVIYVSENINLINEEIRQVEINDNFNEILKKRNIEKNDTKINELTKFDIGQKNITIEKTLFVEYSYTITPYIYLNNQKASPNPDFLNESFKYELVDNPKNPKIIIRYDNMLIFYPILFLSLLFMLII